METNKSWYAVYTRAKREKKVADLLDRKRIENYCPLNKIVRQWSDRKKLVHEPLFTSYVFVYATEAEQLAIKQTDGVLNFVYWLGKPAVIKEEEINTIREFLKEHDNVVIEKVKMKINDKIIVTGGALMAQEGLVTEVKNKSVKIILSSLGYALVAEVEKSNVEILKPAPVRHSPKIFYNASFR